MSRCRLTALFHLFGREHAAGDEHGAQFEPFAGWLSTAALRQVRHRGAQVVRAERLGDELGDVVAVGSLERVEVAAGGECDNGHAAELGVAADHAQEFEAVERGKIEVEHDSCRSAETEDVQGHRVARADRDLEVVCEDT